MEEECKGQLSNGNRSKRVEQNTLKQGYEYIQYVVYYEGNKNFLHANAIPGTSHIYIRKPV